jgi:hypothetical protein
VVAIAWLLGRYSISNFSQLCKESMSETGTTEEPSEGVSGSNLTPWDKDPKAKETIRLVQAIPGEGVDWLAPPPPKAEPPQLMSTGTVKPTPSQLVEIFQNLSAVEFQTAMSLATKAAATTSELPSARSPLAAATALAATARELAATARELPGARPPKGPPAKRNSTPVAKDTSSAGEFAASESVNLPLWDRLRGQEDPLQSVFGPTDGEIALGAYEANEPWDAREWWEEQAWREEAWQQWNSTPAWHGSAWTSKGGSSHEPWKKQNLRDPDAWPGWEFHKPWEAGIRRWAASSDIPEEQRGDRVLRQFTYDMQRQIGLEEWEIVSAEAVEKVLARLFILSGEKAGDEGRKIIREMIFEYERRSNETLSEFVERRRLQVARGHARNLGWYEIESVLLEEGCKLTDQNLINLKTLTLGELKVERIQEALRTLDVTRNQNLKGPSATNKMASMITTQPRPFSAIEFDPLKAGEDFMPSSNSQYPELVTLLETLDEMSVSSGDLEPIYAIIEEQDLGEQEGRGVFMSLVQEAKNKNGKTWAQNKQLKLQIRKNRGYTSHMDTKPRVENRVTLLKSKTRCFICKKRGHWKQECPERSKNSSKEPYKNSSKESYFLVSEATLVTESVMNAIVLLIVEPLHALMDTAAGQTLCRRRLWCLLLRNWPVEDSKRCLEM